MLLLINNAVTPANPKDIAFVPKIRKALRTCDIPFYEVEKIREIPADIYSKIRGILISGSQMRLSKPIDFDSIAHILHYLVKYDRVPVLGLCFGCQILHMLHGGKLEDQIERSCEDYRVELSEHPLFKDVRMLKETDTYHKFSVCFQDLPVSFSKCSFSSIANFHHRGKLLPCAFEYSPNRFGMMIHPEIHVETYVVFTNFYKICGM
jgi:GMP synthase-like glutamine amidotransferase